jgi:transketolase
MQETDELVLSKGHAASALYTVLNKKKLISDDVLQTFYQDGASLAAHPPCNRKIPGIKFGTGSLGHGLSLATGVAFGYKLNNQKKFVYCVVSEGDCNEGSTWEAALFASHHKLKNLTVFVDANGLQGFGKTNEILNLEPLIDKWKAFGFETYIAENGNSFDSINSAFKALNGVDSDQPRCIIGRTTKGSGISFMENQMEWHYLPLNEEQYRQALKELELENA